MHTAKKYHDSEGNECSIFQVVRIEPEWAASVIQNYEKTTEQQQRRIEELEGAMEEWQEELDSQEHPDNCTYSNIMLTARLNSILENKDT